MLETMAKHRNDTTSLILLGIVFFFAISTYHQWRKEPPAQRYPYTQSKAKVAFKMAL